MQSRARNSARSWQTGAGWNRSQIVSFLWGVADLTEADVQIGVRDAALATQIQGLLGDGQPAVEGAGGSAGASGSSGTGGAAPIQCTPDTSFTNGATCILLPGEVPPESLELGTPMSAGQPYAIVLEVAGDMSPTTEIWGANGECEAGVELLASRLTPPGYHCFELLPSAAYTHVLFVKQGNVFGSGPAPRDFCPNGSCP